MWLTPRKRFPDFLPRPFTGLCSVLLNYCDFLVPNRCLISWFDSRLAFSYYCPTDPFIILEPEDQEIRLFRNVVWQILRLLSCEKSVGMRLFFVTCNKASQKLGGRWSRPTTLIHVSVAMEKPPFSYFYLLCLSSFDFTSARPIIFLF